MLKHYLQNTPPSGILLSELQAKHETLTASKEKLTLENNELHQKIKEITQKLNQNQKTKDTLSKSYETLKKESADFITLQDDYKKTKRGINDDFRKEVESIYQESAKVVKLDKFGSFDYDDKKYA